MTRQTTVTCDCCGASSITTDFKQTWINYAEPGEVHNNTRSIDLCPLCAKRFAAALGNLMDIVLRHMREAGK